MIDWYSLGFSALWIMGLGLLVAGLSLANYQGRRSNFRFKYAINLPASKIMISLGLVIFCLGLMGSVSTMWERILWLILGLLFALQTWPTRKKSNP